MDETSSFPVISGNQMCFESKLRFWRKKKGFSQSELSTLSGVNLRTIQDYEQGRRKIKNAGFTIVSSLAKSLEVDVKDLLEEEAE